MESPSVNEELITKIIEKCSSNKLRRKLLEERNLALPKVIQIAQSAEMTSRQIKEYETNQTAAMTTQMEINKLSIHSRKSGISMSPLHRKPPPRSRPELAPVVEVLIT